MLSLSGGGGGSASVERCSIRESTTAAIHLNVTDTDSSAAVIGVPVDENRRADASAMSTSRVEPLLDLRPRPSSRSGLGQRP